MLEANKFWFYSLVCSLLEGCMKLFFGDAGIERKVRLAATPNLKKEKRAKLADSTEDSAMDEGSPRESSKDNRHNTKRRMVADGFDLLIPGSITGWVPTSPTIVGFAGAISTILSSRDIWDRLQG